MREKQNRRVTLLIVAMISMASSPQAFAYLDPTTGSMVISAIVGIFASIALALKTYWYKVKSFFKRGRQTPAQSEKPADTGSE